MCHIVLNILYKIIFYYRLTKNIKPVITTKLFPSMNFIYLVNSVTSYNPVQQL